MYKWDEMKPKERDWMLADAFKIVDKQGFDWAWESGAYSFTTKIEKAWIIIEKLNYAFEIASVEDGFMCTFQWVDEDKYLHHKSAKATSEVVAEAISKAALKAIGINIE